MLEKELIETTDYLDAEDEKLLQLIQIVKQNITTYIGKQKVVDSIKEIIENSEYFSFKSKRNAKYISLSKPLFIITADKAKISKDKNYTFTNSQDDYLVLHNLVQDEITSKYSKFLSDNITNESINKILIENNLTDMEIKEDLITLASFVTSAIFGINIELSNNIIYIEFVL